MAPLTRRDGGGIVGTDGDPRMRRPSRWWRRILAALPALAMILILGTIALGQLSTHGTDLWTVDPRAWNAHPLAEPSLLIVGVLGLLVAALVGKIITWWSQRR